MADESPDPEHLSFESARDRLREKGYLDRGVEGAVLKGALAAQTRARSLLLGAAVGAVFLAVALALSQAVLLAVASALPFGDGAVLFLWLFLPALVAAALLVLVLVGVAFARTRGRGDAEGASTEIAIAFGLLAGIGGALAAVPALEASGPAAAAGVLAAVAAAVFIAVKVARGVTFTVLLTSGRAVLSRRRTVGRLVASLAGLSLAFSFALWASHRPGTAEEPLVVTANARRVVVVGVDGWSDCYAAPEAAPAAPAVGTGSLSYTKGERDPAAFWTTVATGEPVKKHGIGSLDLVRVAGVGAPLRPTSGTDWYLGRVLPAVHLARRESVTAAARRVPAAWEVASRAGIPSLVVNWWTTYPAAEGGGTVLGNHLFFAARAGAPLNGEGWPPGAVERAAKLSPRVAPEPGSLERLIADAEGLDDFSVRAFADASARQEPRLSFLYLPGLDILASALARPGRSAADRVALASALTKEARKIKELLEGPLLARDADLFVIVLDGGRNEPGGVVRLAGPLARTAPPAATLAPEDVAPTLLAVLGVPASREAAGKVRADLLAPHAATPATVASWGRRRADAPVPVDPKEYVENLRSLGYLK
jgi:hypothetical protein